MDLTDEPWAVLEPLLPQPARRAAGRGRPWRASRAVLNGIRWVLRTGAAWNDVPERYPPEQLGHRRFPPWIAAEVFAQMLPTLADDGHQRGARDRSACVSDGTVAVAKQGATVWERPRGARVRVAWHGQTALVVRSPVPSHVLHRMPSPVPQHRSKHGVSTSTLRM